MDTAEIRKTASLCKSEFISKTLAGSHALAAVRVTRRTKQVIRGAGNTTGDTMAARGPGPPHGVAHRDVDCVRHKHVAALPHRDIDNLAGAPHAAHGRPAVLIENLNALCATLLVRRGTGLPITRFSSNHNCDGRDRCDRKNQSRYIRYFHVLLLVFPRSGIAGFVYSLTRS